MTYKINGTEITLQPTIGRWLPRDIIGIDGNGHAIYPAMYQFEIQWQLSDVSEFYQLLGFFDGMALTGTVVAELPQLRSSSYTFYAYTGCVIQEPDFGGYFNEHTKQISLLITNIRAV